jgi:hypothetical protein
LYNPPRTHYQNLIAMRRFLLRAAGIAAGKRLADERAAASD